MKASILSGTAISSWTNSPNVFPIIWRTSPPGLGDVTNESKISMFDNPTFTGNVTLSTPSATVDGVDVSVLNTNATNHISSVLNPHSVTKTQVGLGNVVNTDFTYMSNLNVTDVASDIIIQPSNVAKNIWHGLGK